MSMSSAGSISSGCAGPAWAAKTVWNSNGCITRCFAAGKDSASHWLRPAAITRATARARCWILSPPPNGESASTAEEWTGRSQPGERDSRPLVKVAADVRRRISIGLDIGGEGIKGRDKRRERGGAPKQAQALILAGLRNNRIQGYAKLSLALEMVGRVRCSRRIGNRDGLGR